MRLLRAGVIRYLILPHEEVVHFYWAAATKHLLTVWPQGGVSVAEILRLNMVRPDGILKVLIILWSSTRISASMLEDVLQVIVADKRTRIADGTPSTITIMTIHISSVRMTWYRLRMLLKGLSLFTS